MTQSSTDGGETRLWTSDYVLGLLTAHFLFASYTSLYTMVPPYVLHRGGEEWEIGLVVGSFGIVSLLVRPFAGKWTYLLGAKRVAIVGSVIFAVASILYVPALEVWAIVPVRMLQGVGMAMTPVATVTVVVNLAPLRRRAEALSNHGNSIALSALYSPVVGFWLISNHGFELGFLYTAACAGVAAFLALWMSAARTRVAVSKDPGHKAPLIAPGALFPTAVFVSYTLTTAPVSTFLPLLAETRGLGNPGLYFTVNSLTTMATMLFAGRAADRLGRPALIIPGLLSAGTAMFLIMGAHHQVVFLGAAVFAGAGFGMIQPAMQSFTVDRVPPHQRSSALATLQSGWDIGGAGGALLLGPVAGVLTVASTFGIAGAGALIGAAGFATGSYRNRAIRGRRDT